MRDRAASAPAEDLVSLKQGEFGDQIISETLVDILKRQGKKEKAIEVLKKLIWKFPQKKAYFAAQIEELKQ
jgi:predicted Zn-dependent protease